MLRLTYFTSYNDSLMIPILSREEMTSLDKAVSAFDQQLGFQYMQRAARGLFDLVINRYLKLQKQNHRPYITVFAGKGNNGGDGILLAAYLAEEGYPVKCFILGDIGSLQNEAKLAYLELEKNNKNNQYISFIEDLADVETVQQHFKLLVSKFDKHFLIDALLGIGAQGQTKEPAASLIRVMNQHYSTVQTIAVDLPSGVDSDTAKLNGAAVKAHTTISMGYPKLASFFYPGRSNFGFTIVQNLNYPEELVEQEFKSAIYFANSVKQLMPLRVATGSKYDHGFAVLVAGSPGMEGAASLAAKAAYKSGLGLLKLITDDSTRKIVATNLLECISEELGNNIAKQLEAKEPAVLAIGPGLSLAHQKQIAKLLENYDKPMILDADAINSIDTKLLSKHKGDLLLSPHAGEYARLFGDSNLDPLGLIEELQAKAKQYKVTILYKGSPTIVVDPSGKAFVVPYGNSALATAGTGDVLTGLITGFAAQLYTLQTRHPDMRSFHAAFELSVLTQAAVLASFIHGKAGEEASKDLTEHCVVASDLFDYIPKVLTKL